MKKLYLFFLFITAICFSQPIVVNTTTHSFPQLVEDVLIDSPCALVSNISWSSGATLGTRTGIGYFTNTNPNFPISAGVVMNTGALTNVPGPNTTTLGDGAWPGDNQLFNYIQALGIDPGLTDYNDATIIEFDFMPLTDQMSFNFLFASEEYGTFQCNYSDAFAFFLTDVTTGTVTNLALVPGTSTPVSVITVRDNANNAGCSSENIAYFGAFNGGANAAGAAINFNGQTVLMTAASTVTPNNPYHIKLVVADRNDSAYNSAVFIEAGSFNVGVADLSYPVGIGVETDDMTEANGLAMCPGDTRLLDSNLDPADYNFIWTLDTNVIVGATGPTLLVSQPGTYCLQASNISGASCTQSDCIVVEYLPGITINQNPPDLYSCTNNFNLTDNNLAVLGALSPSDYDVLFYLSAQDAIDNTGQISSNFTATQTVTTIYVRVENFAIPCPAFTQFDVIVNSALPTATISGTTTIPSGTTTVITFTGTPNAVVTYNVDGGPNQTITLDASGNASITTPALTVNSTYNLVSVNSGCVVTLSGSAVVTVFTGPNASVTANTICSGNTGTVTFTGTPNAVVTYTVDGGANQTITLDAAGQYVLTTPVLTANSTYTLVSVFDGTTTTPLTASATVTVTALPTASISGSTTICSGSTAVISFTGTANAVVTYTVDSGANQTITLDATGNASVTTPALTTNSTYDLVSVNGACTNTASGSAVVTVLPLPTAAISGATTICSGATAVVSFTGTPNATITYTVDGGANQTVTLDATGNVSVTTPVLTANSTYNLVSVASATTPVCNNTASGSVTITVNALPTANVTANTICSGTTGTVSFTGTPNAVVTYTVDGGANQTVTLDASGNASVTTPVLTVNSTYALVSVTTTATPICSQAQTASATVTVTALPTASISGSTTICSGSTAVISFTGTANAVVTYTVDSGANQTITLDATGNASVTTPALTANSTYDLVSVNGACTNTASGSAVVTVLPLPTAAISGATTICSGATAVVSFTGTPNATITYTVDGGANQTVTLDATGNVSVTTPVLTANSTYNLVSVASATTPVCNNTASGSVTITVNALPTANVTANTICSGTTGTVSFTGTPNAVVTYTVDGGANQTVTLDASGNASVTTPALTVNSTYALVSVTATTTPACTNTASGSALVTVLPLPTAAISGATTICSGATTVVSFTGTPNATITYTVDSGANQTILLDATGNASVTTPVLTANSTYNLVSVASANTPVCNNTASGSVTITVNQPPVVTATPSSDTICSASTTNIALNSTVTNTTYSWTVTQTNVTGASAGSGNNISQTLTTVGGAYGNVIYTITPTANGCVGAPITVQVDVSPKPDVIISGNATYCDGDTTALTLTSTVPGTTFSWNVISYNLDGTQVVSGTGNTINQLLDLTNPLNIGTVTYNVTPFFTSGCAGDSQQIEIKIGR